MALRMRWAAARAGLRWHSRQAAILPGVHGARADIRGLHVATGLQGTAGSGQARARALAWSTARGLASSALPPAGEDFTPPAQVVLSGRCACGASGFEGHGPSAANFISHSSAPRAASGDPFLVAAAFRGDQVRWIGGESVVDQPPPGSKNPHYKCRCVASTGGCWHPAPPLLAPWGVWGAPGLA